MKPFLILQLRPNDEASNGEYNAFLQFGGLKPEETHRIRMEKDGVPELNLDDYSGVIVGGGPSNVSDAEEKKSDEQKRFESDLKNLLAQVVEKDIPYMGACYGLGAIANNCGATVSKEKYSEPVGGLDIQLTEEAENDPLTQGLPQHFRALGGHKEACQNAPEGATILAQSATCPIQMIRLKNNIYATQFHPELDAEGLIVRIHIYKNAGYFPPEDAEPLIEKVKAENITIPQTILKRFVDRYRS